MIISEEEATKLKSWVVKKLEDISDADSDVLADYVLALVRADTPEPELRLNVIENLEDFLRPNTAAFVDSVLMAIHTRSYKPGHVPSQTSPLPSPAFSAPSGPVGAYPQMSPRGGYSEALPQSRKRSYNDRMEEESASDPHYGRSERQMKQMRRGGSRVERGGSYGRQGSRGSHISGSPPSQSPQHPLGFPAMPVPPPGLPFDPNDPMMAMMTLQAMGLPPLPGMPSVPQVPSPTSYPSYGEQRSPGSDPPLKNKISARCRDYDTKGFCTRGNLCPFEHGNDHIVVPGQDEYDPKNSMLDIQRTTHTNGHSTFETSRGDGRGRARGRGDRGGYVPPRRNRAEFSYSGPNHDRTITTIVVEQIPEERFDEQSVRDFFSEFGNIQNITMQAYKRLALVQYDDYLAARRAYDSPKVIFENRFVKVYWYKPDNAQSTPKNGTFPVSPLTVAKEEEQSFDKEKFEQDVMAAQKRAEEKKTALKEAEAKKQALEKKEEELAQRQADEKKKLLEKLAARGQAGSMPPSALNDSTNSSKINGVNGTDDSKVSAQTKALRAQVAALEAEAKSLGLDTALSDDVYSPRGRGRGRGRGSYRGWEGFAGAYPPRGSPRGRGGFRGRGGGAYNLDNRTKKVGVSGVEFTGEKDEGLRQYLLGIGEYESITPHPDRPETTQVITFKDRFTAEKLMYGTKNIPSVGKLEFEWVNTPLPFVNKVVKKEDGVGDTGMAGASVDGDNSGDKGLGGGGGEVDYDVAEEDDRWMVE